MANDKASDAHDRRPRVLVCGGRSFSNRAGLELALDEMYPEGVALLIEGGSKGADRLASEWATAAGYPVLRFDADWMRYGRGAGPLRNQRMLEDGRPDEVVAFPGGAGTKDMVDRARAGGIKTIVLPQSCLLPERGRR